MTPAETARLLATIQSFDRRTVGETDVVAWHAVLSDYDFTNCLSAVVAHFRRHSNVWLMPAHIVKHVTYDPHLEHLANW